MDSHYYQVMNKRDQITGLGSKKYFAYSTILDQAAFKEWAEQHSYQFFQLPQGQVAKVKDMDLVFNFPSRWWGGLAAGLEAKPGAEVYGVLFEIPEKDWPIIQHKEGFITGMCIEKTISVEVDGLSHEAIAFVTNPQRASQQGDISKRFVQALYQGAQASGLPEKYLQSLKSLIEKI